MNTQQIMTLTGTALDAAAAADRLPPRVVGERYAESDNVYRARLLQALKRAPRRQLNITRDPLSLARPPRGE